MEFKRSDFERFASRETFSKIVELNTVYDFINHIKKYDNMEAIEKKDGEIATFNELYYDILKICYVLRKNNIPLSTNVGVYCNNNYEFACAALGIMAYGCVATLIPFQLDDKTLFGCSKKYDLTGLLYEGELEEKTQLSKSMNDIFYYKIGDIAEINESLNDDLICKTKDGKDPACIIMTGGTTGKSKGAILSNTSLMSGVINGCYGLKDVFHQRYYSIMPLTHVFGFIRNLLTSLYTGSVIFFNKDKQAIFKDLQTFKPSVLVVVPALAEMFLKVVNQFGIEMLGGNINSIICGGASVPPYLVEEYNRRGILFCPGYGLTELANMVSGNPTPLDCPESVGMIFPNIEAKIVNDELWLRGRSLINGYYNDEEENRTAFEDGWFKTGDLAYFDQNNYLYITGRIKDIIVLSNGENVSPAAIEAKVNRLPIIQDSLIYKQKTELGNSILVLEVVLRQNEVAKLNLQPEEVKKYVTEKLNEVNDKLESHEKFSKIIIRDTDFERSPSMKILRKNGD